MLAPVWTTSLNTNSEDGLRTASLLLYSWGFSFHMHWLGLTLFDPARQPSMAGIVTSTNLEVCLSGSKE